MMLPPAFIEQITSQLGEDVHAFLKALDEKPPTSIRYNPKKQTSPLFSSEQQIPWAMEGRILSERPSFTFDPYFHAGHYYVQEASSMFIEQVFKQYIHESEPLMALDLCAAPGGKSTHLLSLLNNESLLIANEVIQTRASILVENISKWGNSNVVVTNNDPEHFLPSFEQCFDLVMVDAPCSGEGMFRKDPDSINEWSTEHVKLCSARQHRILEQVQHLMAEHGLLIYSTCTYNPSEDYNPIEQLIATGDFESLKIDFSSFDGIIEHHDANSGMYGYHFFPHKIIGEGYFISVLRRRAFNKTNEWPRVSKKNSFVDKKIREGISAYIDLENHTLFEHNAELLAIPISLADKMLGILSTSLRVKKFGVKIGQWIHSALIPDQELAMSDLKLKNFPSIEFDYEQAIAYLQKKDIKPGLQSKGWYLVKYKEAILGFAKLLGNRMNSTYPKEWRIRNELPKYN